MGKSKVKSEAAAPVDDMSSMVSFEEISTYKIIERVRIRGHHIFKERTVRSRKHSKYDNTESMREETKVPAIDGKRKYKPANQESSKKIKMDQKVVDCISESPGPAKKEEMMEKKNKSMKEEMKLPSLNGKRIHKTAEQESSKNIKLDQEVVGSVNKSPGHAKVPAIDMEAWTSILVSGPILESIQELGFVEPSQIQKLTIPAAICRRDIIGAAETGSGKTLAFAIPIIAGILRDKANEAKQLMEGKSDGESDSEHDMEVNDYDVSSIGCVKVIDETVEKKDSQKNKLRALIITPTRELAIQIKKHVDSILTKTDIRSVVIIGGMSEAKQQRLLRRAPEIVIGTPGRLWQLVELGNTHLNLLHSIDYLAVDETDRMIEPGHFEELQKLLQILNANETYKKRRQTFIFSATLMLVHDLPKRLNIRRKTTPITSESKIDQLIHCIGVRRKPKVVDITPKQKTAQNLTECKIFCPKDTKETYLYYFLKKYPGRTLVFCNSINCIRRLAKLFGLLQCNPQTLHASKQQRSRLKSLEKFTFKSKALLLATDVAARGLDIPGIQYIIHYEVPQTAEIYIHRSGRTARATNMGLSVMLVEPQEMTQYNKICKTLNRTSEMESFPILYLPMQGVKKRVCVAKDIEKAEYFAMRQDMDVNWGRKITKDTHMLLINEDYDPDSAVDSNKRHVKMKVRVNRNILKDLLKTNCFTEQMSTEFAMIAGVIVPLKKSTVPVEISDALLKMKSRQNTTVTRNEPREISSYSKKASRIRFYQKQQAAKKS